MGFEDRISTIENSLVSVIRKLNGERKNTHIIKNRFLFGCYRGIVVDTRDPRCKGRVKLFIPILHANITEEYLDWCEVSSFFGSLDDQGSVFTPPAGSTVLVIFEGGLRNSPVVIGTLWVETRGEAKEEEGGGGGEEGGSKGLVFMEEETLWEGSPGTRAKWKNPLTNPDPGHLMPPWNNESYNQMDNSVESTKNEHYSMAYPHIYGIKTPRKHFIQFVDGNFDEGLKGKRVVLQSSRGNVLFFKDDSINDADTLFSNEMWDDYRDAYPGAVCPKTQPYRGHKIELNQSGVQLQSFAGHRLVMSDEIAPIEEQEPPPPPKDGEGMAFPEDNKWDVPFQIDAEHMFKSFVCLQSLTEHMFWMGDNEEIPLGEGEEGSSGSSGGSGKPERSKDDGIFMVTATGHLFEMCDHTVEEKGGEGRKIRLQSTSGHCIELVDEGTSLFSPRKAFEI